MYGVIGAVLAGLLFIGFGKFYEMDMWTHPIWLVGILLLVFAGSMFLRVFRRRRHEAAHRREYDNMGS